MEQPRFLTAVPALAVSCRIQVSGVVHPIGPLADPPWGTREFAVLDPDDNPITLYQRTRT